MAASDFVTAGMAALGGGVAVYDYLKAKGYDGEDIGELIASNPVNAKEYVRRIDPTVKVVTNKRDLKRLAKVISREHDPITAAVTVAQMEQAIDSSNNAFAYNGEKDEYVISSKKVNPIVLDHELGHVGDFRDIKGAGKTLEDVYGSNGILRGYGRIFSKSIYDKDIIKREEEAWRRVKTKGKERDRIEDSALGSYHRAFHKNRGTIAGMFGGGVGGALLAEKIAPKRSGLFSVTGSIIGMLPGLLS